MPDFEPFERVLLTIEYDGSAFYGWQRQARLRSVQEELERVFTITAPSRRKSFPLCSTPCCRPMCA